MKKKFIIPMLVLAMALSTGVTGCSKSEDATASQTAVDNSRAVEVLEVQPSVIEKKLTYAGKIEANKAVKVTPEVSGKVQTILVDVGDHVQAGQTLFKIDQSDLKDQIAALESQLKINAASVSTAKEALRQASDGGQAATARLQLSSAVDNAKNGLDSAKKGVESAKKNIDNAEISMQNAQSSLNNIEKKYNDYKQMYDAGVISKSDYDAIELSYTQAKNAYEQAKNNYEQTQIGLTTAENQLEQAQTGYNQAKDSLDIYDNKTKSDNAASAQNGVNSAVASQNSAQVSLQQLKDKLKDTDVKAPCSGVITSRDIEVTNMVSAGGAPMTITDTSTVKVNVNVSETLINKIAVGDSVKVKVVTVSDEELTGKIKTITGVADATGTYPVEVEVNNEDGALKAGMFASVEFVENRSSDTVVVDRNVVLSNETQKYVYIVQGDKKAKKVVVETGIDNGKSIEIVSGLKAGDKVVISGQDYLIDGDDVKIVDNSKDTATEAATSAESAADTGKEDK